MSNTSTLGGWLLKQGPKGPKLWKNRYFELWNDSELHYAASDQNINPQTSLGFIDLRRVTCAENDERNSTDTRFSFILKTPERTYVLAAPSDAERTFWVLRLGMFVCLSKDLDPRMEMLRLQTEMSKLRSDMDFESQKHNMQITDLRRQLDHVKKEKDKEIAELRDLINSKLGITTPEKSPRLSLFRK